MQFVLLLIKLLPYLPSVVRAVEAIFPESKGKSTEKLKTAISMVSAVVPEVVTHLQNEPANQGKLESLIGTVVAGINAADSWKHTNENAGGGA